MYNLTSKVKINRTSQTKLLPRLKLLISNLVEELCHFVGRVAREVQLIYSYIHMTTFTRMA